MHLTGLTNLTSLTSLTGLTGVTSDDGNEHDHDTIDCNEFADEFEIKFNYNDENINVESDNECDNYIHVFDENTRFGTPFAGYTITDDYANVSIDYSFNHANSNSNENDTGYTGCNYDNDIANIMDATRQIELECDICQMKFGNQSRLMFHKAQGHSGIRKHHCHICFKQFYQKQDLVRHCVNHSASGCALNLG